MRRSRGVSEAGVVVDGAGVSSFLEHQQLGHHEDAAPEPVPYDAAFREGIVLQPMRGVMEHVEDEVRRVRVEEPHQAHQVTVGQIAHGQRDHRTFAAGLDNG
jgi:hypothetical protein